MTPPAFELWTIYERSASFIARRWYIEGGKAVLAGGGLAAPTLEEVRRLLPPGLTCMQRAMGDPPAVVETWF